MSRDEFLNRLPEKVICGGEVIEIRKGIADRLASSIKTSGKSGENIGKLMPYIEMAITIQPYKFTKTQEYGRTMCNKALICLLKN